MLKKQNDEQKANRKQKITYQTKLNQTKKRV